VRVLVTHVAVSMLSVAPSQIRLLITLSTVRPASFSWGIFRPNPLIEHFASDPVVQALDIDIKALKTLM
jgi:hypothetical protein